jgi:Ca2+/H+ antiporter
MPDKLDTNQNPEKNIFLQVNRVLLMIGIILTVLIIGYALLHLDAISGEKGVGGALAIGFVLYPVIGITYICLFIDKLFYNRLFSRNKNIIFRINRLFLMIPFISRILLWPVLFVIDILNTFQPVAEIDLYLGIFFIIVYLSSFILDIKLSKDFIKQSKQQNLENFNQSEPSV